MHIFKSHEELIDAVAREIVPELDYKADNLEALTSEDLRGVLDAAEEQLASYMRNLSEIIDAEKRALKRTQENSPKDLPFEIREIIADDRRERRI